MRFWIYFVSFLAISYANGAQINSTLAKPEDFDIFYAKKERIYLTGEWLYKRVACNHNEYFDAVQKNLRFTTADFDSSSWDKMQVPNFIDAGEHNPELCGAMFFKKNFTIPAGTQGKRFILKLEGLAWEPMIFINGRKAAELKNILPGFPTEFFHIDVTEYIKSGSNNISIVIFKNVRPMRVLNSGIYAPVMIDVVNPVYASEMFIRPQLPDLAKIKCLLINSTGKKLNAGITIELSPWNGQGSTTVINHGYRELEPGENQLEFTAKINNPVLWSPANPFLYSVKLNVDGKLAGWERFGLREFNVVGSDFYLNGKKINCYGIAAEEGHLSCLLYIENGNPQFINNVGGCLRKYIKLLRQNNCTSIMRWPMFTKIMNDICDEEGVLNFHVILPFKHSTDMPLWIKRMIINKNHTVPEKLYMGFFYEKVNGEFKQCGKEIFDLAGRDQYFKYLFNKLGKNIANNPSVVGVLTGNENFRDCNQAFDLPVQRKALYENCPGMVFAGEHGISAESMDLNGKLVPAVPAQDFLNAAGLMCGGASMDISHFSLYPLTLKLFYELWNTDVYPKPIPVYADEALYYGTCRTCNAERLWKLTKKSFSPMYKDGKLDVPQMVRILSNPNYAAIQGTANQNEHDKAMYAAVDGEWWEYRQLIKLAGLHVDIFDKQKVYEIVALRVKKMVEMVRMYDQYMQGVSACSGPWLNYDMEKLQNLNPDGIQSTSPIGKMFKLAYSPLFTCLSLYDNQHNFIAGNKFCTKVYAFNNTGEDSKDAKVKVTLSTESDNALFSENIDFGCLKAGSKVTMDITIPLAADLKTGDYKIALQMTSGNKEILLNDYKVFVLGSADAAMKVNFSQTLYILNGKNRVLNETLKTLLANIDGLKVKYIDEINMPADGKFLLIGPDALNHLNAKKFAGLGEWLKNGGRMLSLEQRFEGTVPWLPESQILPLRSKVSKYFRMIGIDLMPVDLDYPAFDKLQERYYWETLNNKYGEVYGSLILPLDKDAKAIGADADRGEIPRCFGALLVEKKVGLGTCILSQVEAVNACGKNDGVAVKYLYNLIKHLIMDK
ncbi:MAG: hypothetical protein WCI51_08060 [Lentisphaerota bacterium]